MMRGILRDVAAALAVALLLPNGVTSRQTPFPRKVLIQIVIDYPRNWKMASTVAPYSARARKDLLVSTPISWEELGNIEGPQAWTIAILPKRLQSLKNDPWTDFRSRRGIINQIPTSGTATAKPVSDGTIGFDETSPFMSLKHSTAGELPRPCAQIIVSRMTHMHKSEEQLIYSEGVGGKLLPKNSNAIEVCALIPSIFWKANRPMNGIRMKSKAFVRCMESGVCTP